MGEGRVVMIGGREFRVGAWYTSRRHGHWPKQLLAVDASGYVTLRHPNGSRSGGGPIWWLEVAGDEVPPPAGEEPR